MLNGGGIVDKKFGIFVNVSGVIFNVDNVSICSCGNLESIFLLLFMDVLMV